MTGFPVSVQARKAWADSFSLPSRGATTLRGLSNPLSLVGFPRLASPRVTANGSWQVLLNPNDRPELMLMKDVLRNKLLSITITNIRQLDEDY